MNKELSQISVKPGSIVNFTNNLITPAILTIETNGGTKLRIEIAINGTVAMTIGNDIADVSLDCGGGGGGGGGDDVEPGPKKI